MRTPVEWHSAHMLFQLAAWRVQCSQSSGGIRWPGYRKNHFRSRESQATDRHCRRPPGNGIRYCCRGK